MTVVQEDGIWKSLHVRVLHWGKDPGRGGCIAPGFGPRLEAICLSRCNYVVNLVIELDLLFVFAAIRRSGDAAMRRCSARDFQEGGSPRQKPKKWAEIYNRLNARLFTDFFLEYNENS